MAVLKTKIPKIKITRAQSISKLKSHVRSETARIAKKNKKFQTRFLSADQTIAFVKSKFPTAKIPNEIKSQFESGDTTIAVGNFENIRATLTAKMQSASATARKFNAEDRAFLKGKNPKKFLGIPVTTIALPDNSGVVSLYRTGPNSKTLTAIADRYRTTRDTFISLKKMRRLFKRYTN